LNEIDRDPETFLDRVVTGDETWCYLYDPESKVQSKQWMATGSHGPIKFKSERSVKNVMATIFWDCEGVILLDFLEDKKTITGPYYENVLRRLHDAIKRKRPGKLHKRVLFHHDNAPAHSLTVASAALRQLKWEILPHPPYSPDLAPSDFFLFPNLKENIRGENWGSISEVERVVKRWFADQRPEFYRSGLESWRHRMEKCIEMNGDYVEKS
jgi:histone-lysine N-methyltransferase SETMAR